MGISTMSMIMFRALYAFSSAETTHNQKESPIISARITISSMQWLIIVIDLVGANVLCAVQEYISYVPDRVL